MATAESERGGAGGPGQWAFLNLAGCFADLIGPDNIPEPWVWRRNRAGGGTAGGMVRLSERHATVLLRLDGDGDLPLQVLREVAEQTEPFSVAPTKVTLHRNGRLSTEFGSDVYSIGIELFSPELVALRDRFIETLAARTVADEGAAVGSTEALRVQLIARHNPYNSRTGGHTSVAYVVASALAGAETLQARTNAELQGSSAGAAAVRVESLTVKSRGGETEVIRLGNFIPLECRAISLAALERFAAQHADHIGPTSTTADVVSSIIVPGTKRMACSYAAAMLHAWKKGIDGVDDGTAGPATADHPAGTRPPTGKVDVFCSHAWVYPFLDLLDAIRDFSRRHVVTDGDTAATTEWFFWLDIFAVNQHNIHSAAELPKLQDAIATAKQVMVVLTPWERPIALTRIWCLFEVRSNLALASSHPS